MKWIIQVLWVAIIKVAWFLLAKSRSSFESEVTEAWVDRGCWYYYYWRVLFEKLSCNLFYILLLESGNTIPTSFKLKIQKQIPDILSTKSKVTLFLSERIKKSFPLFLLRLSFISLDKLGLEFFKKVDEELGGTHTEDIKKGPRKS